MPTANRHAARRLMIADRRAARRSLIAAVGVASVLLTATGVTQQLTTPVVRSHSVTAQSHQNSLIAQSFQSPGDTNWG